MPKADRHPASPPPSLVLAHKFSCRSRPISLFRPLNGALPFPLMPDLGAPTTKRCGLRRLHLDRQGRPALRQRPAGGLRPGGRLGHLRHYLRRQRLARPGSRMGPRSQKGSVWRSTLGKGAGRSRRISAGPRCARRWFDNPVGVLGAGVGPMVPACRADDASCSAPARLRRWLCRRGQSRRPVPTRSAPSLGTPADPRPLPQAYSGWRGGSPGGDTG